MGVLWGVVAVSGCLSGVVVHDSFLASLYLPFPVHPPLPRASDPCSSLYPELHDRPWHVSYCLAHDARWPNVLGST